MAKLFGKKGFLGMVSVILTLCLCVGMLVAIPTTVAAVGTETVEIWSGPKSDTTAIQADFDTMSKDVAGNYLITNGEQLYAVIKLGGQGNSYKLANDIYLNENYENYASWNASTTGLNVWDLGCDASNSNNFTAITTSFNGVLDGDGYTIYGFYSKNSFYGSLIPLVNHIDDGYDNPVVIKNLNMAYGTTQGGRNGAFILGGVRYKDSESVTIENCTVRNGYYYNPWTGDIVSVGTIVGDVNRNTVIKNCAVYDVQFKHNGTDATAYSGYGAIVGNVNANGTSDGAFNAAQAGALRIEDCYSVNVATTGGALLYPVGIFQSYGTYSNTVTLVDVYSDGTEPKYDKVGLNYSIDGSTQVTTSPVKSVTANGIKGIAAKTAMPELDWLFNWSTVENGYPVPVAANEVWDGPDTTVTFTADSGTGEAGDPYKISNGDQLYAVVKGLANGKYIELTKDIYLNKATTTDELTALSTKNLWANSRSSSFYGYFNGNGHTVYGMYHTGANANALFPGVDTANGENTTVIENLNLAAFYTTAWNNAGGLIGNAGEQTTTNNGTLMVKNCTVRNGNIYSDQKYGNAAGIIGANYLKTTVTGCAVYDVAISASTTNEVGDNDDMKSQGGFASIVGVPKSQACSSNAFDATAAAELKVFDSFALNVTMGDTKLYPIGVYMDGASNINVSATVNNVYTDATQPTYPYNDVVYKLVCTTDGVNEATVNPITTITGSAKGENAKVLMPNLDWKFGWITVDGYYPVRGITLTAWDGTTADVDTAGFGEGQNGTSVPFEITNGAQLYAAVTSSDGYNFVLMNDIYLNSDYVNYKLWKQGATGTDSNGNALNAWITGSSKKFVGSIDGNGYTVYGLYAYTTAGDAGLIPHTGGNATINNLNVKNSLISCGTRSGVIVGRAVTGTTSVDSVSVSNIRFAGTGIDTRAPHGGIIGLIESGSAIINNTAVYDVVFESGAPWGSNSNTDYASFGAFVGANKAGDSANTAVNGSHFSSANAANLKVYNSYSYNVINAIPEEDYAVYPIGIHLQSWVDSQSGEMVYPHKLSATVQNVYTDAEYRTFVHADVQIGLQVSYDGKTVAEDVTTVIKPLGSDNMQGLLDSGAWYVGKLSEVSATNLPKLRSNITRYTYADINGDGVDAAYTADDIMPVREYLLGTVEYAYIDGDANSNGAIDIRDLVNVYSAVK